MNTTELTIAFDRFGQKDKTLLEILSYPPDEIRRYYQEALYKALLNEFNYRQRKRLSEEQVYEILRPLSRFYESMFTWEEDFFDGDYLSPGEIYIYLEWAEKQGYKI